MVVKVTILHEKPFLTVEATIKFFSEKNQNENFK